MHICKSECIKLHLEKLGSHKKLKSTKAELVCPFTLRSSSIPISFSLSYGTNLRIGGVQRLQRTTVYHIQNTTEETLDFALDHEIPVGNGHALSTLSSLLQRLLSSFPLHFVRLESNLGWELLKAKVDQEIKLDKHTVRFFFKLPPLKTTLFKIQHKKENRTADVCIHSICFLLYSVSYTIIQTNMTTRRDHQHEHIHSCAT